MAAPAHDTDNRTVAYNTIVEGQLSTALMDMLVEDIYLLVPQHMPADYLDGFAQHIEAAFRNVLQREDPRHDEFTVHLCRGLQLAGFLHLEDDGTYRR